MYQRYPTFQLLLQGNGAIPTWRRLFVGRMHLGSVMQIFRGFCGTEGYWSSLGFLERLLRSSMYLRDLGKTAAVTNERSSLALGSILQISTYPDAMLLIFRLLLAINIVVALYPLYKPRDEIADIPLTPSQRALLGLDPNSTPPATPGTQYITPPRYRLSSGPRPTSAASPNGSPLSRYGSSDRRPSDSSSFSPSASPLFYKGFANGSRDTGRRHSFGSPSPLGRSSLSIHDGSVFRSPSPSGSYGRNSGQVLTNKWLYERNRMNF